MRERPDLPTGRRWLLGGASLVLAATMAGCGSDDSGGAGTSAAETSASEAGSDPAEFCEASVDLEAGVTTGGPQVDDTAPPAEQQAALEAFGAAMEPLLADVENTAPDEVSADVTSATGIIRDALSGGDPSVLEGAGTKVFPTPSRPASWRSRSPTRAMSCTRSASHGSTTT